MGRAPRQRAAPRRMFTSGYSTPPTAGCLLTEASLEHAHVDTPNPERLSNGAAAEPPTHCTAAHLGTTQRTALPRTPRSLPCPESSAAEPTIRQSRGSTDRQNCAQRIDACRAANAALPIGRTDFRAGQESCPVSARSITATTPAEATDMSIHTGHAIITTAERGLSDASASHSFSASPLEVVPGSVP